MRRRHIRKPAESATVNLTPLMDLVFILLIFFVVTASFVKEAGLEVKRPQAENAALLDRATVRIAISADGAIWMEHQPIDVRAIRAKVARILADRPEAEAVVIADTDAPIGLLVQVMDQVRSAGVSSIAIAAQRERD